MLYVVGTVCILKLCKMHKNKINILCIKRLQFCNLFVIIPLC